MINLDSARDRLEAVNAQLKHLDIIYSRVSGINGKGMSQEDKRQFVNYFRWWCAVGRFPTDGEIGCALSHAKIYRHMLDEGTPYACILEDDVILDMRFCNVLNYVESIISRNKPQVMLLSNHSDSEGQHGEQHGGFRTLEDKNDYELRPSNGDFYAECYVLNQKAAENLLRINSPLITPYDWWGRWVRREAIELYHVFPTVAMQNKTSFDSTTALGKFVPVNSMSIGHYLCHKFKRLVGISIDRLLSRILT